MLPASASALTVAISTAPAPLTLTHGAAATTTAVYTVTSLAPSWTLSVLDRSATTPGHMDQVDCVTNALSGGSLGGPLAWSSSTGATSGSLSAQAQLVASGSLAQDVSITYSQALTASDEPTAGDCFRVDVTIRVLES